MENFEQNSSRLGGVKMSFRRLVEEWLPLFEMNFHSEVERSFKNARNKYRPYFVKLYGSESLVLNVGSPQPNNLHPWLARRPAAPARILTLASFLPANSSNDLLEN